MPLTPLEVVQQAILASIRRLDVHDVDLGDALGLVLAVDVTTDQPVPPFANTAMDGYAIQAADTVTATVDAPVRLRVVGDLPAGKAPDRAVNPGEAIRIMTGAPMPDGADSVVMVERTRRDGDDAVLVEQAAQSLATTCVASAVTSRPARRSSPPAPWWARRTSVSSPASASPGCPWSAGPGSACSPPATS